MTSCRPTMRMVSVCSDSPELFFGISTVYKKFCLRPTCQHAVHLEKRSFMFDQSAIILRVKGRASVSRKVFRSDVVFVNASAHKHLPHSGNHGGRSGAVIDGTLQCGQMPRQHLSVYRNHLALPFFLGF